MTAVVDTVQDAPAERRQAHAYLDHLNHDQFNTVRTLPESMLTPLERSLANAPADDEPLTEDDRAAIAAGLASRQEGVFTTEDILAGFGLTLEEFERLDIEPFPET